MARYFGCKMEELFELEDTDWNISLVKV
jgi:hypothetical protein